MSIARVSRAPGCPRRQGPRPLAAARRDESQQGGARLPRHHRRGRARGHRGGGAAAAGVGARGGAGGGAAGVGGGAEPRAGWVPPLSRNMRSLGWYWYPSRRGKPGVGQRGRGGPVPAELPPVCPHLPLHVRLPLPALWRQVPPVTPRPHTDLASAAARTGTAATPPTRTLRLSCPRAWAGRPTCRPRPPPSPPSTPGCGRPSPAGPRGSHPRAPAATRSQPQAPQTSRILKLVTPKSRPNGLTVYCDCPFSVRSGLWPPGQPGRGGQEGEDGLHQQPAGGAGEGVPLQPVPLQAQVDITQHIMSVSLWSREQSLL